MSKPDIRIGDTEREEALKALGEHMSAGRLELDEYGDRTAMVTTAKTRRDLLALFADLPEPHPRFGEVARPAAAPVEARPESAQIARRLVNALVPLTGLVCVLLFFTVLKTPLVFLLVPIVAVLVGSLTGDQHGRDRDRRRRR
ncbi:DUF1707 domain-containing protein [Umezawaea sp. Da 62-37]|uniref:DUF1707 SHOCT-like domain-containing protein n=1 Tax=Umezawaea sp. Da 62-37 TaxID=3075927 RepID=UPI0028F6FCFC|nr:DUF1707 domain-containing protein [Umezawaea sp. Da 62-37]WNV90664.1 DUF1707 domain-containing protein [Umezawaea sp. Da 62-37]